MQFSISMLAFALLTAGFLWPTEEAVSGLGLHLTVLWTLLGLLHELQQWWSTDEAHVRRPRFDAIDLGVLLIAIGHVISTLAVFQVEGDRRAALNLTFEWIGLLVAWRVFRSLFQNQQTAAQGIAVVIAMCVGLSCFGIWQHHVFYAEQSEWYRSLRVELDQALASGEASQFARMNEITQQFQEREIPMYGSSRIAWENRLLSSSEPFATFSLANTLAGLLATGLVLLIGQASSTVRERRRASWRSTMLLVIQVCLITYCLILTKSRSAWLGTGVGLGILLLRRIRLSAVQNAFRWLVAGSLITAMAVGIVVAIGGLDKEVILESPRSLQFRLLYWTGTLKMLRDQPLTGAGPGNFRQVYLQHKADESSEEIRDPHNFVLDAWSSSGLIGLSGLLLVIGCTGWRLMQRPTERSRQEIQGDQTRTETEISGARFHRAGHDKIVPHVQKTTVISASVLKQVAPRVRPLRIAAGGILSGFLLHIAWTWFNGSDEWTSEPTRLLLLGGALLLISRGQPSFRPVDSAACLAAASAIMINLLAAGGFEMPAVMITLLMCLAAGIPGDGPQSHFNGKKLSVLWAAGCLAACTVIMRYGLLPVTSAENHIRIGNSFLINVPFPSRALDQFQQAVQADPQSVTPRQRIAEVLSYRLSGAVALRAAETDVAVTETGAKTELSKAEDDSRKLADEALQACENLISADRRNVFSYRLRAEMRWNAGLLHGDDQLQILAIEDLSTATRLYPSSVDAWYRLAERLDTAGADLDDAAKVAAERVLQLENLNRAWGHADRFLTEEQLAKMTMLMRDRRFGRGRSPR